MAMNTTDKIKSCFKQFKTYLSVLGGLYLNELPQRLIQYGTQLSEQLILHIYLLLLASPKKTNKQTNRKNIGRDTATAVANYSGQPWSMVELSIPSP